MRVVTYDPELAAKLEQLRITPTRYEGPTGIVGTIHDACRREGLSSVSLWAAMPHYLGATANPSTPEFSSSKKKGSSEKIDLFCHPKE